MTEHALSGAAPDLSIGFVNGSGPVDPRSRRKAVGAKPSDRVPAPLTGRPGGAAEFGAPLLGTAGWQTTLAYWQRSLDVVWRANAHWLETMDALVHEHLTQLQE